MLAGLGNAGTWLRSLFPPWGWRYELFDTSIILGLIAAVNYALTEPPPQTVEALNVTLPLFTEMQMGVTVTIACTIGIVCSYRERWAFKGYLVVIASAAVMGWFLFGGALVTPFSRTFVSALLFLSFASRLLRELLRRKRMLARGYVE